MSSFLTPIILFPPQSKISVEHHIEFYNTFECFLWALCWGWIMPDLTFSPPLLCSYRRFGPIVKTLSLGIFTYCRCFALGTLCAGTVTLATVFMAWLACRLLLFVVKYARGRLSLSGGRTNTDLWWRSRMKSIFTFTSLSIFFRQNISIKTMKPNTISTPTKASLKTKGDNPGLMWILRKLCRAGWYCILLIFW